MRLSNEVVLTDHLQIASKIAIYNVWYYLGKVYIYYINAGYIHSNKTLLNDIYIHMFVYMCMYVIICV